MKESAELEQQIVDNAQDQPTQKSAAYQPPKLQALGTLASIVRGPSGSQADGRGGTQA